MKETCGLPIEPSGSAPPAREPPDIFFAAFAREVEGLDLTRTAADGEVLVRTAAAFRVAQREVEAALTSRFGLPAAAARPVGHAFATETGEWLLMFGARGVEVPRRDLGYLRLRLRELWERA